MNLPKKIGDYTIIKELGNGAYGVVYLVKKENDPSNLVLKQISLKNLKPDEKKNIENEANLLKELNSKYIVKYIDSFEKNNYLNIIMEYCDQGDLDLLLKSKKKNKSINSRKMGMEIISSNFNWFSIFTQKKYFTQRFKIT